MSDERDAPPAMGERADEMVFAVPVQEPSTVVRRGSRRARWAVVAVVVVLAAVGAVLVLSGSDEVGADEALAGARAAVQGDDAYRVVITVTGHQAEPDDDEAADSGTRTEAEVVAPDRWRALDGQFADGESYDTGERRRVGDEVFGLDTGSGATTWRVLPAPEPTDDVATWVASLDELEGQEFDAEDATLRRLVLAMYVHVVPIGYDPAQVERLVLQATDPVVEERLEDGAVRLRTTVAPIPELAAAVDVPVGSAELVLDLDGDHRPQAARVVMAEGGDSLTLELAFSDWGAPLRVDPPTEDDVERTPWVEELELGQIDPELVVLPAEVPEGFELVTAAVEEEEGEDDEDCSAVRVEYATRAGIEAQYEDYDDEGPTIELTVGRLACEAWTFDERLGGRPATDVDDGYAVVRIGDVYVDIDSDLDDGALADLVRSLEQVAPEELIARFPDWLPEVVAARFD